MVNSNDQLIHSVDQSADHWAGVLREFLIQADEGSLKTSSYPKEWLGLTMRVSFGQGMPARVPWISLVGEEMVVSRGIYPVYLYYKRLRTLILAYGISETEEAPETWPTEVFVSSRTIRAYFDQEVARYGESFVFKAYKIELEDSAPIIMYAEDEKIATSIDLKSDLATITNYYKKVLAQPHGDYVSRSEHAQGLFYMEKQLEDFMIQNWDHTELGNRYELIYEEGDLQSQQYKTDIGLIDILARDKKTGGYIVIELKRNQSSDDTVGQVARYMGWIKRHKETDDVGGIIITGQYDKKLDYALDAIANVEVFIYEVNFQLKEFRKNQ